MRSGEHVHRIELQQAEPAEDPAQVAAVHPAGWPALREPTGGDRDPPDLHGGKLRHRPLRYRMPHAGIIAGMRSRPASYRRFRWNSEIPPERRRAVLRDAAGIGIAVGAYGISFGAVSVAAGLSVGQACTLSALAFTGASQFAFVGVVGAGGAPLAGMATALLLGSRNTLYALRMSGLLRVTGARRLLAAHATIDETTAMAVVREEPAECRLAFWSTAVAVFSLWNLATLLGALSAGALGDPRTLGLDAAVPAAFLGLLWPRLHTGGEERLVALAGAAVAIVASLVFPAGVPVLLAALVALRLRGTR